MKDSKTSIIIEILEIDQLLPEKINKLNECTKITKNKVVPLSLIDCIEYFRVEEKLEKTMNGIAIDVKNICKRIKKWIYFIVLNF